LVIYLLTIFGLFLQFYFHLNLQNNKNLQVNLNSTIEKIIIEKNKAIGVEYRNNKGELNKKFDVINSENDHHEDML